jgi:hypothetical protein
MQSVNNQAAAAISSKESGDQRRKLSGAKSASAGSYQKRRKAAPAWRNGERQHLAMASDQRIIWQQRRKYQRQRKPKMKASWRSGWRK